MSGNNGKATQSDRRGMDYLTGLSLCAGIGGLDEAIKIVLPTFQVVCRVEREAYCIEIMATRDQEEGVGAVPCWTDVRSFDGRRWRGVIDILTAGYPCQPSVSPVLVVESAIRDICGPTSPESLRKCSPASCFSKTSADTFLSASTLFGATFDEWAIELRRDCLRRRKRARRIGVRGFLFWASATASISKDGVPQASKGKRDLRLDIQTWPTPKASDGGPEVAESKATRPNSGGIDLQTTAMSWQTPASQSSQTRRQPNQTTRENLLPAQATSWPTPNAGTDNRNRGAGVDPTMRASQGRQVMLQDAVSAWPTPGANDHKGSHQVGQRRGQLDEAAEQIWQTPPAMGGGATSRSGERIDEPLITGQARNVSQFFPPDQATPSSGAESSPSTRRLNPRFVEWLMGYPPGWTDFAPLAMPLSQFRERLRISLSGIVSAMNEDRKR